MDDSAFVRVQKCKNVSQHGSGLDSTWKMVVVVLVVMVDRRRRRCGLCRSSRNSRLRSRSLLLPCYYSLPLLLLFLLPLLLLFLLLLLVLLQADYRTIRLWKPQLAEKLTVIRSFLTV